MEVRFFFFILHVTKEYSAICEESKKTYYITRGRGSSNFWGPIFFDENVIVLLLQIGGSLTIQLILYWGKHQSTPVEQLNFRDFLSGSHHSKATTSTINRLKPNREMRSQSDVIDLFCKVGISVLFFTRRQLLITTLRMPWSCSTYPFSLLSNVILEWGINPLNNS